MDWMMPNLIWIYKYNVIKLSTSIKENCKYYCNCNSNNNNNQNKEK